MVAKVISCLIVAVINTLIAFFTFAIMIVAMNGFSESTASWGIYLYIVLQVIFVLVAMILTFFLVGLSQNRWQFNGAVAGLISIGLALVLGLILSVIAFFAGIIAASIAWNNR